MPKNDPYICPRCDYHVQTKRDMKKHFYERKTECTNNKNLELTDAIKEIVLKDRKYYKPKNPSQSSVPSPSPMVQYNYIAGLDCDKKLGQYLNYTGGTILDINDFAESLYAVTVDNLEKDQFRTPHLLPCDKFLELVDDLVKTKEGVPREMNILYDDVLDRIKIYCDGEWESYFIDRGIQRIITILRTNYLDRYECYLYTKIFQDPNLSGVQYNDVKLHLNNYYKFLAVFDHTPLAMQEPMSHILHNYRSDNPKELSDYGSKIYQAVKDEMNKTEIGSKKKEILDIIKRNHRVNVRNLNSVILELIDVDQEFKKIMLGRIIHERNQ